MKFTDEDLKMLKEWNDALPKPIVVGLENGDEFYEFYLDSLLRRLEAAERALKGFIEKNYDADLKEMRLVNEWRETCTETEVEK